MSTKVQLALGIVALAQLANMAEGWIVYWMPEISTACFTFPSYGLRPPVACIFEPSYAHSFGNFTAQVWTDARELEVAHGPG